jgi:hypothetical protein
LENTPDPEEWWKELETQWQQAFRVVVLKHSQEPTKEELQQVLNLEVIRLAGPSAPFPNCNIELDNLSGIQALTKLSIVVITHHKIKSIEAVGNLHYLQSLFLFNNCITSLTGIENLSGLEQLFVQQNQISSIKPVEKLLNLREIYIQDNCVDSLDGLTEKHSDKLTCFICRPNSMLKQKEIIRAERELGIICR